jgi:hypothetical protein
VSPEAQLSFYPFLHMTGHGNVVLVNQINNLNKYLLSGVSFTLTTITEWTSTLGEIKKIFPNNDLIEIPANAIFQNHFFY